MDGNTIYEALRALGSEQTRKTLKRHGAGENLFGVKRGDMEKLRKQVKVDHAAALELWDTGNYDARIFAAMILDPAQMDEPTLTAWSHAVRDHGIADMVAGVIFRTPHRQAFIDRWIGSDDEWLGRIAWSLVVQAANDDPSIDDETMRGYVEHIERDIHSAKNRVREAMNTCLIAVGVRNESLRDIAVDAAKRIGPVDIDHGDTACETPDAVAYIAKTIAYRAQKASEKAGKAGKTEKAPRGATVRP